MQNSQVKTGSTIRLSIAGRPSQATYTVLNYLADSDTWRIESNTQPGLVTFADAQRMLPFDARSAEEIKVAKDIEQRMANGDDKLTATWGAQAFYGSLLADQILDGELINSHWTECYRIARSLHRSELGYAVTVTYGVNNESPCPACGKPGVWTPDDEWAHIAVADGINCAREGQHS